MSPSIEVEPQGQKPHVFKRIAQIVLRLALVRELLVILGFFLFTSILTWPYVTRLRDAVVDEGDPYLCAWILWWDYHQTFTDPLNLFHANTFYPFKYTLAFSEHSYGIALLMFPFYLMGLRPLTVQTVAIFLGFVVSGYGAFRLARTLSGSSAVAWVSGIVFAFVPYRFHLMSQVVYLFSPWIPLVFEALVLFIRKRTKRSALWLGCAFFMSGLSTLSWFVFTLVPFLIFALILLTRYRLWRDKDVWLRGSVALLTAMVALLPFTIPYLLITRLYGFQRTLEEVKANSAMPVHWLSVEVRNKLWNRMGEGVFEGWRFKLFPGLLPILFSVAGLRRQESLALNDVVEDNSTRWKTVSIPILDRIIVVLFSLSLLATGFDRSTAFHGLFTILTSERALGLLTIAVVARLCLGYPSFLVSRHKNLLEMIRSKERSDGFWLAIVLVVIGFSYSLGWNFFFFRLLYYHVPIFKGMRGAVRGAMLAYLGLALLSGLGVQRLVARFSARSLRVSSTSLFVVACLLLLFELNAAPLSFVRGQSYADAVTLRLKHTAMRGGIVELPVGGDNNHRYMLRAADHAKPLIVGTSGFISPIEHQIETLMFEGPIKDELMDLMESVPTSYLVIANPAVPDHRRADYEFFLARHVSLGRLRFINRFDGRDDLYAVVKNEPEAMSEAPLPFGTASRDWATAIHDDPVSLLGGPLKLSQRLFRIYVATTGDLPRYADFIANLEKVSQGVIVGDPRNDQQIEININEFVTRWVQSEPFRNSFANLDESQFVNRLIENSRLRVSQTERDELIGRLAAAHEDRVSILLKIVDDARFVQIEASRSLVLLHYFGYLRRNPDDRPDGDLRGFKFWVNEVEKNGPNKLPAAFSDAGEYHDFVKRP